MDFFVKGKKNEKEGEESTHRVTLAEIKMAKKLEKNNSKTLLRSWFTLFFLNKNKIVGN